MARPIILIIVLSTLGLHACNQNNEVQRLQTRIDSLEHKLADTYKPGFGEFMSSIQVHHNKLWFAGQNQNWKLADFEIHEIKESVDDIIKYQAERPESKKVDMLYSILDSVEHAIQIKNISQFNSNYVLLTNTCNNCHRVTEFEFNVVKTPESPPFSNQDFKINN
jgi:hypothetical protein